MNATRLFAISLCFAILFAIPLALWLTWQFAYRTGTVSAVGQAVLVPFVLIAPLVISLIAYKRGTRA